VKRADYLVSIMLEGRNSIEQIIISLLASIWQQDKLIFLLCSRL